MILDFERQIIELEEKIVELKSLADNLNIIDEINKLQGKVTKMLRQTYANLTPWQKVQVSRHPQRPQFLHYTKGLFEEFIPLAGDRFFAEDHAIIGGIASLLGQSVMIIGQHKGHDMESRIKYNFGMPKPEGYRKAMRLMKLAEKYKMPLLTFIDTPGAYPGIEAEERGQSSALATSLECCLNLKTPIISIILGEGSSGGAIAIGAGNRILMLEHSIYSVISPESCASILWRNASKANDAADAQKLTAQDLAKFGIVDEIISEPLGGAHRNHEQTLDNVKNSILKHLKSLSLINTREIVQKRQQKFLQIV